MQNINKKLASVCFIASSLTACGSMLGPNVPTPHENFVRIMKAKIGMKYDDPPDFSGSTEQLVSSYALLNGHLENGYRLNKGCIYFYEINPATRKIVGFSFKGSEQDCSILP